MATLQLSSTDAKRLTENARQAANQAAVLLKEKAGPQLVAAKEWVSPRAQAAWRKGLTAASPKVAEAAALIAPRIDDARDLLVDKALPAIVAAVDQAARKAAEAAQPPKPKRRGAKLFLFTCLAGLIGGAAYWLWRKTQPKNDPWAEGEWEAFEQTTASAEEATNEPADVAEAEPVAEAAEAASAAEATVKKVTTAAKKAAKSVKAAVSKDNAEGTEDK
ncbi:MAG: hypothetical protein FWG16_07600 [Micrococcales bacterium]|nr:hypothetical protein [Micrococcales bacterium]